MTTAEGGCLSVCLSVCTCMHTAGICILEGGDSGKLVVHRVENRSKMNWEKSFVGGKMYFTPTWGG